MAKAASALPDVFMAYDRIRCMPRGVREMDGRFGRGPSRARPCRARRRRSMRGATQPIRCSRSRRRKAGVAHPQRASQGSPVTACCAVGPRGPGSPGSGAVPSAALNGPARSCAPGAMAACNAGLAPAGHGASAQRGYVGPRHNPSASKTSQGHDDSGPSWLSFDAVLPV